MPIFLASAALSLLLALIIRQLALKAGIVDLPDNERKRHLGPVPLLGGLAIFFAFWIMVFFVLYFTGIERKHLFDARLLGMFLGGLVLVVVGFLDDKFNLRPAVRFGAIALAAFCVIAGGSELSSITNPFGGYIPLDIWRIGDLLILANIIIFFWISGMTLTVKVLDGLDGLATGVVMIGALMIYFLTASGKFYQADVSIVALILAGACLGFLLLNFYPAKIFLGEAGGMFLGFILGALAIVAGGKIATALLVMAVPVLDFIRVVYLRLKNKQPILQGDRRHLHFMLVDMGMGHRRAVLLYYCLALAFGISTLFLRSSEKLLALGFLTAGMVVLEIWLARRSTIKRTN